MKCWYLTLGIPPVFTTSLSLSFCLSISLSISRSFTSFVLNPVFRSLDHLETIPLPSHTTLQLQHQPSTNNQPFNATTSMLNGRSSALWAHNLNTNSTITPLEDQ
uniref:Putative secreted peptide n=1 Tax=Anopheles braziliensis TaxID=58242 RepID=A0A2M3ZM63_9DIPT